MLLKGEMRVLIELRNQDIISSFSFEWIISKFYSVMCIFY